MKRWDGNGVVVETSDAVTPRVLDVAPPGRKRRGVKAADDALASVLDNAGMLAAAIELKPQLTGRTRRAADTTEAMVSVDVAANEEALLLVESEGGVFAWVHPEDLPTGKRRRAPETRTFRFGGAATISLRRIRGGIVDWFVEQLVEPVKVYVLRFVVGAALDMALKKLEGDIKEGLVSLGGEDAASWVPGPVPKLTGTKPRILLFVHGTFSSTAGSYGQLTAHKAGQALMTKLRQRYDAIVGFDHKTLGLSAEDNAKAMYAALKAWGLPQDAHIDAVAYSRGGLVYRCFAEDVLAAERPDVTLGKAVFVGCTNSGTHLAEPDNWKAFADLATNLLMAGSRAVLGLSGGAALAPIVCEAVRILGRFVQLVPQMAISESKIPGLASMEPGSATVKALNTRSGGLERLATYYAATSNFEAKFEPKKGLTDELKQVLLDTLTNQLFQLDNDLVVDTRSMTGFGTRDPRHAAGARHEFGTTDTIYHTIYFTDPALAGAIATWLLDAEDAATVTKAVPGAATGATRGGTRSTRRGPTAALRPPQIDADELRELARSEIHELRTDIGWADLPATISADIEPPKPQRGARGTARTAAAPPKPSLCHFGAEMEPYPALDATVPLTVTVSAKALKFTQSEAAKRTEAGVPVAADKAITLEVIAKTNCVVIDDKTTIDIAVPVGKETVRHTFYLNGVKDGAATVLVEARQDMHRLVQFELKPTFVTKGAKPIQVTASASLDAPPAGAEVTAVLRVYEISRGDAVSLQFTLECRSPNISISRKAEYASKAELKSFVAELYNKVERMWAGSQPTYAQFTKALEASGKTLARNLLPEDIHDALWTHRDAIAAIQVISDEPIIPWELLFIADPAGGAKGRGFLCEWGMVRWLHNAPWPLERLKLRADRARYVVPDYADAKMKLAGATEEKAALKALFKQIKEAPAESVALCNFLESEAEGCDLLHFACHGEAFEYGNSDAELHLTGRKEDGRIVPDSINGDQVRTSARFGLDGDRPLVFINACQSGRPGTRLIQGVGGLIEAFIRPDTQRGAGAAVGTLWSVEDKLALTFAKTFYGKLLAGETLIAAAQAAREAAKSNEEMTWLAYTVYGDPFARVED